MNELTLIPVSEDSTPGYRKCDVADCYGDAKASGGAKGKCPPHYQQTRRSGTVTSPTIRKQVGLDRVNATVSSRAMMALTSYASDQEQSTYEALREIINQEMPRYEDRGLPDRVAVDRGDASNVVQTNVPIETLVRLTNIGRLSGNKSRGWVASQILERWALTRRH